MMRYFQRFLPSILVLLTTLAVPELAFASDMPSVRSQLHTAISKLFNPLQTATKYLFFALAFVELSVFFFNHVLKNRGQEEFFGGIIKKVITLMFFLTIIDQAGVWLPAIVNGIGGAGSSLPDIGPVTAGTIAEFAGKAFLDILGAPFASEGHNISTFGSDLLNLNISGAFSALGKAISGLNPVEVAVEELMALIIALLVGISILWLALEYIMVQVESYLVLTFGIIMLAGGGLRWTTKYVSSYFDYAINVGVRLFLITVIAYLDSTVVINKIMVPMLENAGSNFLQTGFNMLTLGAIMALLPKKASSVANSILSGQSTFSGGDLGKSMTQVVGGTALAAGAVAGGAVLGAGAAAGAIAGTGAGSLGAAAGAETA
nr:P-type conjugative transfer protein TrbL [Acidithiobacillus sp.]